MSQQAKDFIGLTKPWPVDELEDIEACPVCGSPSHKLLYENLTDRVFFCAPGEWTVYRCNDCRSAYLDPRPTEETISLAYKNYYTHSPQSTELTKFRPLRRLTTLVANDYWNCAYGGNRRPAFPLGWSMMAILRRYKEALDRKARYLPCPHPGASLLDIGFGDGEFLEFASTTGWVAKGIDTDPVTVENAKARGLNVRHGSIDTFADTFQKFDAITISHVIEHVHNPDYFLKRVAELLKPGGQIYLETPNIEALGHRRFGRYWRGLEAPRHLTLFTWQALETLLGNCGFYQIHRIRLTSVYAGMAAKSRAISQGKDPYSTKKLLRDRLFGLVAGWRTRLNHRHSEFIALTARKS